MGFIDTGGCSARMCLAILPYLIAIPGVSAASDDAVASRAWVQACRPHLEWVKWDPNLDVDSYADMLVAHARQTNCGLVNQFENFTFPAGQSPDSQSGSTAPTLASHERRL